MDDGLRIVRRTAKLEDKGFILKSWLMGNYYGDWHFQQMDQDFYYKVYTEYIKGLLALPKTQIEIAVADEAPDMAYGYIVFNGPILIWAFVKPEYRGQGIMNFLVSDKEISTTLSTTKSGSAITRKKGWLFNPFAIKEF